MSKYEDAAAGMLAALNAIRATADGDEGKAMAILNDTSPGESHWAAAYLLQTTVEAVKASVKGDERRLEVALRRAADRAELEDILMTQVELILHDVKEA